MKKNKEHALSRRAFAHRAALLSATASLVPVGMLLPTEALAAPSTQLSENPSKLSVEGQTEADARFQMVLSRYGSRLSEEEKSRARMLCFSLQSTLDRVRAYPLENGEVPALFLKPLLDRNNKPKSVPAAIPAASPKQS